MKIEPVDYDPFAQDEQDKTQPVADKQSSSGYKVVPVDYDPFEDDKPAPRQDEPGMLSKAVSAVVQIPAEVWQKGAELAEEYLPESVAPAVSGYARTASIGFRRFPGFHEPSSEEVQKFEKAAKQTFGEYGDIPTSFVSGVTANYTPRVATPADSGRVRALLPEGAYMLGMIASMRAGGPMLATKTFPVLPAIESTARRLAPEALKRIASRAATEGTVMGVYEGLSRPDEGETRLGNLGYGVLVGGAFGIGGGVIEKVGASVFKSLSRAIEKTESVRKLYPVVERLQTRAKAVEQLSADEVKTLNEFYAANKLTDAERTALDRLQTISSVTLGGSSGALQPADDWQERLSNIGAGAALFAGVHVANPSGWRFLRPVEKTVEDAGVVSDFNRKYYENIQKYGNFKDSLKETLDDLNLDLHINQKDAETGGLGLSSEDFKDISDRTTVPVKLVSSYYKSLKSSRARSDAESKMSDEEWLRGYFRQQGRSEAEIADLVGDAPGKVAKGGVSPSDRSEPDKEALAKHFRSLGYSDNEIRFMLGADVQLEAEVLSPQRQGFVDEVRTGKLNGFDIVNHAMDITKDEGLRTLYGQLLLRDDLVESLKGVSVVAADDISGYAVYRYNIDKAHIGINTAEITDRISLDAIIFEEIGHSLMDRHIRSNVEARSKVRSLMDIAIGELDAREVEILRRAESATGIDVMTDILSEAGARSQLLYGLVNEWEFLANAFSRKGFQEFLKGIKVESELEQGKVGSLWERFVLWVNDVLFSGVDHTTLLHKALETGADVIERQSAERQARFEVQDGVEGSVLIQWTRHTTQGLADLGYNMKDIQDMKERMPLSDVQYILSNKIKPEGKPEESYAIKDNSDKIGQLYDKAVENKNQRRFLEREPFTRISLGKVSDDNVDAVKKATGIDLTGYERTIDSNDIKHILKEHSDPEREAARGQRVVTREDIKRIPEIVESPTRISLEGLDAIVYEKKINGDAYYVEEVRTRKRNIATKTMYIKSEGTSNVAPSQGTPTINVRNVPPTTSTVPQPGEPVKWEGDSYSIAAYHGTAADFDKFDLSKIGTGEGAQGFSWGLYFTSAKDIAKYYAQKVAQQRPLPDDLKPKFGHSKMAQIGENKPIEVFWMDLVKSKTGKPQIEARITEYNTTIDPSVRNNLRKKLLAQTINYQKSIKTAFSNDYGDMAAATLSPVINGLKNGQNIQLSDMHMQQNPRYLYSVVLHPDKSPSQYDYLTWEDKPTPDQLLKVYIAVTKAIDKDDSGRFPLLSINDFEHKYGNLSGGKLYAQLTQITGSPKDASMALLDAGIDGMKYKAMSGTGGKTGDIYNYVVYDPKAISIEQKESYAIKDKSAKIGQLYDKAVENNKQRRFLEREPFIRISLGKVSDGNAQAVKKATGIDLTGYERTIDNQAINYILTEHSDPEREAARGQRVVTKQDIQRIPEIVESPDDVFLSRTKGGVDAIKYMKKINGDVYYIEEVRTRKRNIAAKTMWIKSEWTSNVPPSQETPALNVRNAPPISTGDVDVDQVMLKVSLSNRPDVVPLSKRFTEVAHRVYTNVIDRYHPIKRFVDDIERSIPNPGNLPMVKSVKDNPYIRASLFSGIGSQVDAMLTYRTWDYKGPNNTFQWTGKGLKEILSPVFDPDTYTKFVSYLVSRRAVELHGRGFSTGVDHIAAKSVVKRYNDRFIKIAEELERFQDNALTLYKDAGMLSQESYDRFKQLNKYYVPFYRVLEEEAAINKGEGLEAGPRTKRIEDGTSAIIDPIESIMKNTSMLVTMAEKNKIGQSLVRLSGKSSTPGSFIERFVPPKHSETVRLNEMLSALEQVPEFRDLLNMGLINNNDLRASATIFRPSFVERADVLQVYYNGKPQYYKVPVDVGRSWKSLDVEQVNLVLKWFGNFSRSLMIGATSTPSYFTRNVIRDVVSVYVVSKYRIDPQKMFEGLFDSATKSEMFWKWMASGGAQSFYGGMDRDKAVKTKYEMMRGGRFLGVRSLFTKRAFEGELSGSDWKDLGVGLLKTPLDVIRAYGEIGEQMTRISNFRAGLKVEGETEEGFMRSGYNTRDTLDFARCGAKIATMNKLVAFFNSTVQGIDKTMRTLAFNDNPKERNAALFRAFIAVTVPSVILAVLNQDDERYHAIPRAMRDQAWIIPTEKNVWRIPKPFEIGIVFGSLPERIVEYMYTHDGDAFRKLGRSIYKAFLPGIIPTFSVPFLEAYMNRSLFFDREIVPGHRKGLLPQYQTTPRGTELAKAISAVAVQVPGLGYIPGVGKVLTSPAYLENAIRAWGGGGGINLFRGIDKGLRVGGLLPSSAPGPTPTLADVLFIKGFVLRRPDANSESIQKFYDTHESLDAVRRSYLMLVKSGKTREAAELLSDNGGVLLNTNTMYQALLTMMQDAERMYQSRLMSPAEKRVRIDDVYKRMDVMAKQFNREIKRLQEQKAMGV